tara:strand:- start:30 stop:575 length:546 start_codon:yes stop_codon:yes gene_type:complete
MELIQLNRDPRLNDFSKNDLVLNTVTGDLFAKTNTKLFKIISRNQFDQTTTDAILKLISEAQDDDTGARLNGFQFVDGFYRVLTSNPRTGSNVSLHGGIPFDYGQPLPNSPYIKSNGGFDILMDNANTKDNSSFRVLKNTGIAGISPSVELLRIDDDGNLTVKGTISGSTVATTDIDGGSF